MTALSRVVLLSVLVLTACDADPRDETAAPAGLDWVACGDDENWSLAGPPPERRAHLTVECTTLAAPIDHDDPESRTLDLALVRVRDDRQHDRIGSLVLNPGGPAASGLDFLPAWASWFPDSLLERFDLVTFDPRGTPIAGAQALVRALGPSATLLVSERPGHTSFGSSPCVDGHVVDYLLTARAPAPRTWCHE